MATETQQHADGSEISPPASTLEEASSKGLLAIDAVRNMYDNMAEEYLNMMKADASNDAAIGPTRAALRKLCSYRKQCPEGKSEKGTVEADIVEVGCGPGTNLVWLAKEADSNNRKLIGVDLSPAMIDLAKKESNGISGIDFQVGDMLCLDFANSSITAMCNLCCIQHVDLEGVRQTISEAARVLIPGGMFLLQFWIGEDAPMPGPEGAAFIGWKLDTVRSAISDVTPRLEIVEESQHVYPEFDMPYSFYFVRKKEVIEN